MPIALASQSTAGATGTTLTLTKPTGLAVGDLMVAVISIANSIVNAVTISTASGWTQAAYATAAPGVAVKIQYKEATSGDVAASNFSFTTSGGTYSYGALYRLTDADTTLHIPEGSDQETNGAAASSTLSFSPSVTFNTEDCLVFVGIACTDASNPVTVSGYTSTPALTWTEDYDQNNSANIALSAVHATNATITNITAFSATLSQVCDNHATAYAAFRSDLPASGTAALFEAGPAFQTQSGAGGVSGTAGLLSVSPTTLVPTTDAVSKTTWTQASKNSTTWTQE